MAQGVIKIDEYTLREVLTLPDDWRITSIWAPDRPGATPMLEIVVDAPEDSKIPIPFMPNPGYGAPWLPWPVHLFWRRSPELPREGQKMPMQTWPEPASAGPEGYPQ